MYKFVNTLIIAFYGLLTGCQGVSAQTYTLNLHDAIEIGQAQSYEAVVARLNFMSKHWSFRSYKAELLPSVNLQGGLMEFNRSLVETRNYEDGEIRYVDNNTLTNNMMLSLDQNIVPLGGTLSLQSYLYRLDQFSYDNRIYNSRPIRLNYTQPLFAYNRLKWMKKTAPLEYDIAKRTYLEAMEGIGVEVVRRFFNVLATQSDFNQANKNLEDRKSLFEMAQRRLELGTITKSEALQLELSVLNAEVELNELKLTLANNKFSLLSYLRLPPDTEITLLPPYTTPDLVMNVNDVIHRAVTNSTHSLQLRLNILESEQEVARAKSERGIQLQLYGEIGLSNTSGKFRNAYSNLQDNEIVGLTLSLPIFDWGVGKGKVKMAQADLEATRVRNEQTQDNFVQEVTSDVNSFNIHSSQCRNALRAQDIADERYDITKRRFESGSVTVTELNTAWQESENARTQYIKLLQSYWSVYYSIRKTTLFDWLTNRDIEADFDNIIEHR